MPTIYAYNVFDYSYQLRSTNMGTIIQIWHDDMRIFKNFIIWHDTLNEVYVIPWMTFTLFFFFYNFVLKEQSKIHVVILEWAETIYLKS